jgi:hypothetical protein
MVVEDCALKGYDWARLVFLKFQNKILHGQRETRLPCLTQLANRSNIDESALQ